MDTSIFKAYDIRGIYPDQLNEEVAELVGRGYATLLRRENPGRTLTVVLSHDMRLSGPALHSAVLKGLTEGGLNVVSIGLASTPSFYFAVAYHNYDGGIQISASHNLKEFNGLKMVRARSTPIGQDTGIQELQRIIVHQGFEPAAAPGTVTELRNVAREMVCVQSADLPLAQIKPFTIVVDAANSMGGIDAAEIFRNLSGTLTRLNFQLDGNFPSHTPDPFVEENLTSLKQEILRQKADLGIAIDGDSDRYFFVDEKGQVVRQEILRGIMAQIALQEHPGATICYDVRPGKITREMIESAGGKPSMTKVGHSLIKQQMLEVGAVFGGESSGHYFYQFPYGTFEAPAVLVYKFLLWLSAQNQPLSAAVAPYRKYFHSGEINTIVKDRDAVLAAIQQKFSDGRIDLLDGVSVEYPDYWFNVRASNTEPLIRLNLEARSQALMEQKRDEVLKVIRA